MLIKQRIPGIVRFFAFNLLFFALYLNFIYKDKEAAGITTGQSIKPAADAFSGPVLINNPEKKSQSKTTVSAIATRQ